MTQPIWGRQYTVSLPLEIWQTLIVAIAEHTDTDKPFDCVPAAIALSTVCSAVRAGMDTVTLPEVAWQHFYEHILEPLTHTVDGIRVGQIASAVVDQLAAQQRRMNAAEMN